MNLKKTIMTAMALLAFATTATAQYSLWYDAPAKVWTDALPLGNGRLGAMVYGIPAKDEIQLNEETIWTGQPNSVINTKAAAALPRIRQLMSDGNYSQAMALANSDVLSTTNHGMAYQPFGSLHISQAGAERYTDYRRELSLDSALTTTVFTVDGISYKREVITSFTDDVVMVRLTASQPGKITFSAHFTTPQQDCIINSDSGEVTLLGVSGTLEKLKSKVRFMGRMAASVKGSSAKQLSHDGILTVTDADEAVVYVSIATNFVAYNDLSADESTLSESKLRHAMARDYVQSKADHVASFRQQMCTSQLSLGEDRYKDEPTDVRLINFKTRDDNGLVATYYAFGRYLLICSSQPGGQAANLQGIWNDKMSPSWDSKYTTNINLEMNYWPSETTSLSHLNDPLFRLTREVSITGSETARKMYDAPGWVLHHNTDIWRITGPVDAASSGLWMTGGAWLSAHLWRHWLFTGDREFLAESYPVMKGAAEFLDHMLIVDPQTGCLVLSPAVSPENSHSVMDPSEEGYLKAKRTQLSSGTTMDNELIMELYGNVVAAARTLGIDAEAQQHFTSRMKQLQPLRIGRWGQLQEWDKDWDDPADQHRHVSHLYALYPGNSISPRRTPQLFSAARTSLLHRGDPSTGWSMGWKVCLWARMLDGNHAYKLIHDQLTLTDDHFLAYGNVKKSGGTYRNLFDAHPPFQIDGNFGCTAGIAEMLVQSHDGSLNVLPALPDAWRSEGSVTGLCAQGGFVVKELAWREGKITRLVVESRLGGNLRISSPQPLRGLKKAKGTNSNPLMQVPPVPQVENNSKVDLSLPTLPAVYQYDINTRAGQTITIL